MEPWRAKAMELLPELAPELDESDSPMQFWIEIGGSFQLFPVERSNRAARREARKQNRQPHPWAKAGA